MSVKSAGKGAWSSASSIPDLEATMSVSSSSGGVGVLVCAPCAPVDVGSATGYVDLKKKAPAGMFNCRGCLKQLPLGQECPSRPGYCRLDSNSYKALSTRWAKQRSLKTWWEQQGPTDKANWYRKQQACAGDKRKFTKLEYAEIAEASEASVDDEVDDFMTFTMYKRWNLLEGKQLSTIEADWVKLVEDPSTEAVFARGQWLVPEFTGIKKIKRSELKQRSETVRKAQIESSSHLEQLKAGGAVLLKQFSDSVAPAPQLTPAQPVTNAAVSDQPICAKPTDVITHQVVREVS